MPDAQISIYDSIGCRSLAGGAEVRAAAAAGAADGVLQEISWCRGGARGVAGRRPPGVCAPRRVSSARRRASVSIREVDGATKLVLRTAAGLFDRIGLMRTGTGRVSLCVSSQVGCAAACGFCATGQMGIARNLSAGRDPRSGRARRRTAGRPKDRRRAKHRLHGHGRAVSQRGDALRSGRRTAGTRALPLSAAPHPHLDRRHSRRHDPLRAPLPASESRAQPAQRPPERPRAVDPAGDEVFARRAAGRRRRGQSKSSRTP